MAMLNNNDAASCGTPDTVAAVGSAAAADPAASSSAAVSDAAEPMMRIEGLRKSFGDHEVLKGVDLTVMPG